MLQEVALEKAKRPKKKKKKEEYYRQTLEENAKSERMSVFI